MNKFEGGYGGPNEQDREFDAGGARARARSFEGTEGQKTEQELLERERELQAEFSELCERRLEAITDQWEKLSEIQSVYDLDLNPDSFHAGANGRESLKRAREKLDAAIEGISEIENKLKDNFDRGDKLEAELKEIVTQLTQGQEEGTPATS